MQIREVKTPMDLNRFIAFTWTIYRDDPYWVPPLLVEQKETLNPKKHPFYLHGTAAKFLLYDGGEVIGRILAADDPRFNEENKTEMGTFGFFECVHDQKAAQMLFSTVEEWSRARGRTSLMGPMEYSTNYTCGLLIDGFETPPRIMMPHNPPYYHELISGCGFKKNKDLFAWWFQDTYDILEKWTPHMNRLHERHEVRIRPFSRKHFQADVKQCLEVYDAVRSDWWWYCVSLTKAEVDYFAKNLSMIGDENLVFIAEDAGVPIGFSITMPDLNEAIKPLNGRLTWFGLPIGLFRLWRNIKHIKTARMMVLCILPKYRRKGVAEQLILRTLDYGKNNLRFTGGELSWTDETNDAINKIAERVGAKKYKTYRVFEKQLTNPR